jgi:hypothetical protein
VVLATQRLLARLLKLHCVEQIQRLISNY